MEETKITSFDSVKNITTEDYFQGNQFSIDAFKKKYALHEKETYAQAVKRVCDFVASVESTQELRDYWSARWFDEIYNDWWHPAGSIMQGAGSNRKISLCNCTTISLGAKREDEEWDNLESIIKNTAYTIAKCAAYRQGLGVDFSRLRPNGCKVLNSANQSTGAVHWMEFEDKIGYFVGQKGRIPAMLFSITCDHPDVEEFIQVKSDYTKIQNANISVQLTEKFYTYIAEDPSKIIIELKGGQKIEVDPDEKIELDGKVIKAKEYYEHTKSTREECNSGVNK
jgi:ribonucleoside-diphosphate reductase alpha chain